jgi:hypothetical protein
MENPYLEGKGWLSVRRQKRVFITADKIAEKMTTLVKEMTPDQLF